MEDRETREQFRRAYKVFGIMQKRLMAEGMKASQILRRMANILEQIEDYPELSEAILRRMEKKWL